MAESGGTSAVNGIVNAGGVMRVNRCGGFAWVVRSMGSNATTADVFLFLLVQCLGD